MKNKFLSFLSPKKTYPKLIFPLIDLSEVKGVLIDFDDTLYSFASANEYAMAQTYSLFRKYLTLPDFNLMFKAEWENLFQVLGNIPVAHQRMTMFQTIAEKLHMQYPFYIAAKAHRLYYKSLMKAMKRQKTNPEALAFLKTCKKRKIPVCLVTDLFALTQTEKLQALNLIKYFTFVVANDEVGQDKPASPIFQKALEKLHLAAQDVIMIGDNLQKDIEGAKSLGIKTYLVSKEHVSI